MMYTEMNKSVMMEHLDGAMGKRRVAPDMLSLLGFSPID